MGPRVLASNLSHKIQVSINPKVRKISIDSRDSDLIPKIIQRERKRAGLEPYSQEELEKIVSSAIENVSSVQNPEVRFQIQMDLKYFRRCLELRLLMKWLFWFGDDYINDPMAIKLRKVG